VKQRISLPVIGPLEDGFERTINYLRVSLTDRCNYRCTYCMPAEGVEFRPRADLLSFEEIERVVRVFAGLGVRRVRLTGGEPTVRADMVDLVARLTRLEGIERVVMTSNGHRLPELAEPLVRAGLAEVNVSIDTLDPERFRRLTRRGDLARVIAGIDAARAAGLRVKLNAVALKGENDTEVGDLCAFAWDRDSVARFIEHMPMSDGSIYDVERQLTAAEIRDAVAARFGVPVVREAAAEEATGPSRYWHLEGQPSRRFGIISAMSEHFCDTCNRVRITAVGDLHTCLAYDDAVSLRDVMRAGGDDATLRRVIADAVALKRAGHEFQSTGRGAPSKHMIGIGG
jgi:GTP 3',8-cyclase